MSQNIKLFFYRKSAALKTTEKHVYTVSERQPHIAKEAGWTRKTGNQPPCFSFSRWNRPAQRLEWEQAGQFRQRSEQRSCLSRQPGNPQLESGKEHRGECLVAWSNARRTKQQTFTQVTRAEMDFISRNPRILKKQKTKPPFTHNLSCKSHSRRSEIKSLVICLYIHIYYASR